MSDTSGGFNVGGSADRLSAMRAPATAVQPPSRGSNRGLRIEFVLGILLILGGIAVALYVRGAPTTAPMTSVVMNPSPESGAETHGTVTLLAGEVAAAFAVEDGNYPPSLRVGDVVRIVVTPGNDGAGEVRSLLERTVVMSIDEPSDAGTKRVVTVRGPESIVTALASSGPVHVAVLGGSPS